MIVRSLHNYNPVAHCLHFGVYLLYIYIITRVINAFGAYEQHWFT